MTPEPSKPLVSVVVPVYNHARYIGQCLDSVFSQTHRPLQLIVIDDGSRDDSARVVGEYLRQRGETPGVEVIFRARENRGAHDTINEGLASANGEYFAILNSDDFYHPERIGKCLHACEAAGAELAFSYVEAVDADGEVLPFAHPWRAWYDANCFSELAIAPTTGFVFLENNLAVSTGNLFFRRSLYLEVGPFKDYVLAHDLDFILRALLVSEPYLIKEKLYFYRLHGSNTVEAQRTKAVAELEDIWAKYVRTAAAHPPRNPMAPCHWYWPVSYEWSFKCNVHLARAREGLLIRPAPATTSESLWRKGGAAAATRGGRSITVITHELTLTGAPKVVLEITALLLEKGVEVRLISLSDGPLRKSFEDLGVRVNVLQTRFAENLADRIDRHLRDARNQDGRLRGLGLVARGLRRLGKIPLMYDAPFFLKLLLAAPFVKRNVYLNSFSAWPIAVALGKLRSFDRMVWFIHESCDPNLLLPGRRLKIAFSKLARKPWLRFVFGSDATRTIWSKAGIDGVTRYWSGLASNSHPRKARAPGAAVKSMLSVGTGSGRKGTRLLVEAFALAIREQWIPGDVTLTIVGIENPSRNRYSADLLSRVAQMEFGSRIRLVPPVEAGALNRYYEEADLYVQSSTMECLPLALLTAMAFGLPIVTTDVDGCKEAIIDGVCGRVIAPRSVRLLARAIADTVTDPARSFAYGEAARAAFIERFSLEATESALLETILG